MSLGYWALIFQGAVLVCAIHTHRTIHTPVTRFLLAAAICYVLNTTTWFTFYFAAGFILKDDAASPAAQHTVAHLRYYTDHVLNFLFAAFMIAALVSMMRARSASRTTNV